MIQIVTDHPAGGRAGRAYPDARSAILALAGTLTAAEVGRLKLDLHTVQLALNGVAVVLPPKPQPEAA